MTIKHDVRPCAVRSGRAGLVHAHSVWVVVNCMQNCGLVVRLRTRCSGALHPRDLHLVLRGGVLLLDTPRWLGANSHWAVATRSCVQVNMVRGRRSGRESGR
jgi:hypothetical protein